jgi:hypothetical protein
MRLREAMRRLWHRVEHGLWLNACVNDTEWRGDALWHVVTCVGCGQRVIEFAADHRRWPEAGD